MSRRRKKRKQTKAVLIILIMLLLLGGSVVGYRIYSEKIAEKKEENLKKDIATHYNKYIKVTKDTDLYKLNNNKYEIIGKITKDQELTLSDIEPTSNDIYFKIESLDGEYYIYYKDVSKIEALKEVDTRYKNYLPFNKNIITNKITNFYDEDDNLIYTIEKSFNLPIIINDEKKYGIEYNNRLLYIKKDDVKETIDNHNTDKANTTAIAVLNYHFFYDETKESERKDCNQYICMSTSAFSSHLNYIKDNNIFTLTLEEYEMWYDGKIKLPKSVVITIDDGWRMTQGNELLEEYELNGNVFLITSWWDEEVIESKYKYVNYYSHGDNLHNQGVCPGGQGGAIKCQEKEILLKDLALSKKKVEGKTFFCYPFYEYNNYSISILKEAGFTMAFAGNNQRSNKNSNRYAIPRYVIYNNTTVSELKRYIG